MIKLCDLSDVEVEDYIKNSIGDTDEYLESVRKNKLIKKIDSISLQLKKIKENVDLVRLSVTKDDFEKAFSFSRTALLHSRRCYNSINSIKEEMGVEESSSIEFKDTDYCISGGREGNILHIILPELLPDKVRQGEKGRYEELNKLFYSSFRKFFEQGRFPVYDSKAVLCFINIYESEQQLKDHDNFEVKQVIDILSAFILTDDNPKWCSHYMDYRMGKEGEKCHSEIFVVPQSNFMDFIKTMM